MSTRSKSFWSTIPGLITGLAGILTALVGLGTLLIQIGVIGGDNGDSDSPTVTRPGATASQNPDNGSSDGTNDSGTAGSVGFTVAPDELKLTSGDKTGNVTVSNTGGRAFTVSAEITGSGKDQFQLSKGNCGADVPRSGSCTMTVEFDGGLAGKAELIVRASGGASSQRVQLEGSLI